MIRVLIIDDELPAREIIKAFLEKHTDVEVIGECENGFEAIKAIQEQKPDIIFLDIQMPKLTGFEMLELLDEVPVVIFTTAYDEYAIKAFERNAADYLLKPFSSGRFDEALKKAHNRLRQQNNLPEKNTIGRFADVEAYLERIAVRNGKDIIIIPVQQIVFLEAQDDYVAIHSRGKRYLKQLTMKYLEKALPENSFLRVHRSFIININEIKRIEAITKDSFLAILTDDLKVPVSRSGYGELKKILDI